MKKYLLYFLVFISFFIGTFRSLLLNITSHLPDWYDYSLQVYIMFQNIAKIKTLDFEHFFNSNSFYPRPYGMLLSDLLLPQSLIALPFTYLSANMALIFNIVFICTFVLNYLALYLFWKQLFGRSSIAFLGALFFIYSPFTLRELGHFQMLSYWPFFFTFYFILKTEATKKRIYLLYGGLFFALQFLASVYLAVFLILSIFIFYFFKFLSTQKKKEVIIRVFILFVLFVALDGVFIGGYFDMKRALGLARDYGEFVTYSAHITDYFFTTGINSLLYSAPLINWWNSFNRHTVGASVAGPGILLLILSAGGIYYSFRNNNKKRYIFLFLMAIGFIFSLGPRFSFNGAYLSYHLPYVILLRLVPFFESIRVVARWNFLFYIGIIYFSLYFIIEILKNKKIAKKSFYLFIFLFLFFLIEYIPVTLSSSPNSYLSKEYDVLKKACRASKKVLLEVPITHLQTRGGILVGLKYINDVQLASLYHGCYVMNGYSGYDFPELITLDTEINQAYKNSDSTKLMQLLRNTGADYVKINGTILMTSGIKSEIIQLK